MEIILKKNQSARITFPMIDSVTPKNFKSGLDVAHTAFFMDGTDAPAALAIAGTVTEINSEGMYTLDLSDGELNHDLIIIKFTASGTADSAVVIRTYVVNIEDLVRSATPSNALGVGSGGDVSITQAAADKVWSSTARTLTSFGTLAADVWTNVTRSLTEDVGITQTAADKVWSSTVRTLSSFGNLVADIWNALTSGMTLGGSIGKRLVDLNDVSTVEVRNEAVAALEDKDLDHFVNNGTAVPSPASGTFFDKMMNKDGTQSFTPSTDSLEALADAGGGSGPSADTIADAVWAETTREITGGTVNTVSNSVDILQTAADRVWYSATRTLTGFGSLVADIWNYTTRLLTGSIDINSNAEIIAIKERTDKIPDDPATEANVDANEIKIDALQGDVTAIKTKSDNLPADMAAEMILIKGALGFNCVLDDFTYDGNGKATAGTLYIYDSDVNAQNHDKATGLLKKISGVAVITGGNTTKLIRTEESAEFFEEDHFQVQ